MKIKCIIFDFDGVILDSNRVKKQAYFDLFPDTKEVKDIVSAVWDENGRLSRVKVIQYMVEALQEHKLLGSVNLQDYIVKYGDLTQSKVAKSGQVPGAFAALKELSEFSLFVNTSTPDILINEIMDTLDIQKYFTEVFGSTTGTKAANIRIIMSKYSFEKDEVVHIGDGDLDLRAAKETGIHFIGVVHGDNNFATNNNIMHKVNDLENLGEVIGSI